MTIRTWEVILANTGRVIFSTEATTGLEALRLWIEFDRPGWDVDAGPVLAVLASDDV